MESFEIDYQNLTEFETTLEWEVGYNYKTNKIAA